MPRVVTRAMTELQPLPAEEKERLDRLAAQYGVDNTDQNGVTPLAIVPPQIPTRSRQPFMPDFSKIQIIDLEKNVVVVDGCEFEFDQTNRDPLIRFCMDTVLDTFTKLVAKAAVKYKLFENMDVQKPQETGETKEPLPQEKAVDKSA